VRIASSVRLEAMTANVSPPVDASSPPRRFLRAFMNAPGMANWRRQQVFNLDGPAIFRTGGGGGDDDDIWGPLQNDGSDSEEQEEFHEGDSPDSDDEEFEDASAGDDATEGVHLQIEEDQNASASSDQL